MIQTSQQLTSGVISDILIKNEFPHNPVVQILQINFIQTPKLAKYEIKISDGVYYVSAFAGNCLNDNIQKGTITIFSIVKLIDYNLYPSFNKNILIINHMEPIGRQTKFIRNPQNIMDLLDNPPKESDQLSQHSQGQFASNDLITEDNFLSNSQPSQPPHQISLSQPSHQIQQSSTTKTDTLPVAFGTQLNSKLICSKPINQIKDLIPSIKPWTILARVVLKSSKHKSTKNGKTTEFFSIILKDTTGEIRGIFFNHLDLFDKIEYGEIYEISGGSIRDNRYKKTDHKYEISFDRTTVFNKKANNPNIDMYPNFKFCKLQSIENMPITQRTFVDIIVYIYKNSGIRQIQTKNEAVLRIRTLVVCDDSGTKCELELLEEKAVLFGDLVDVIVAFKDIEVVDKKGRLLQYPEQYYINPEIPENIKLAQYVSIHKSSFNIMKSISDSADIGFISLSQINKLKLNNFYAHCIISNSKILFSHQLIFSCCPNTVCKHKQLDQNNYCKTCNLTVQQPNYHFVFNFEAMDFSGSTVMLFKGSEKGALFTGRTAEQFNQSQDRRLFRPHIYDMFNVKIKVERSSSTFCCSIDEIEPVNYAEMAMFYVNQIRKYD